MVVRHEDCWAKTTPGGRPGIPVIQHCRTVGIVAERLAAQCADWLREALAVRVGVALASLHDIGKVSPGFQAKCAAWLERFPLSASEVAGAELDHAKVSQRTLQDFMGRDDLRFWAAIVGAHHGTLKGDRLSLLCDGGEAWNAERKRLLETLTVEFGPLPGRPPVSPDCAELWFNAGLIAVADWLASDERSFPPSKELDATGIRERVDKQFDRIGFRRVAVEPGKVFGDLFDFDSNHLQAAVSAAVRRPGIYIVEAPMGCGKTEAALLAAYGLLSSGQATGLYFALPTQTTSNRIHRRVDAFIARLTSDAGVRLIHGNSWLMDSEQPLDGKEYDKTTETAGTFEGRDWFASPRRALLAPFGVGTVDQTLLGVVAAKHFFVRQFGLAGKVVILDEVHSYDLYTGTLLDQLVVRLRGLGATVIVLSATLTAARRGQLLGMEGVVGIADDEPYPLLSCKTDDGFKRISVEHQERKTISLGFKRQEELAEDCLARAESGQCVLWIRNTVYDAQATYRQLCGRSRTGGPEIALLHARFPQFRRDELEGKWLDRLGKEPARRLPGGCVLVSTQVAEQSVDIDADLLITDLAPTDMLLQRMGRLWRHSRPRPVGCASPETWVALPDMDLAELREAETSEIRTALGKSARVYAPYILLRTLAVWRDRISVGIPSGLRPLLEATYAIAQKEEPPAWRTFHAELENRKKKLQQAALANSNPWQMALDDKEGVQTRWNSCPSAAVLVVQDSADLAWDRTRGANLPLLNGEMAHLRPGVFDYRAAQAIHRNLVKVPRWTVRAHLGRIPDWLKEYVRDGLLVCKCVDGELIMLPGGNLSGLSYRADLGVVLPAWEATNAPAGGGMEDTDDESYD